MLNLDFSHYQQFLVSDTIPNKLVESNPLFSQNVDDKSFYFEKVLSRKQGFLDLPYQTDVLTKLSIVSDWIKDQSFENIVIVGIGGSMLGTQTIVEALNTSYTKSKFIFIDNLDNYKINETIENVSLEKTLFIIQSKSGNTPEIVAQYSILKDLVLGQELLPKNHFVFVTDPETGFLRFEATSLQCLSLDIPKNVGGRFSVLTPVGILINELIGKDSHSLLKGAGEDFEKLIDQAFELAKTQFAMYSLGKNIQVSMMYSSRLESFGNWVAQLVAESLGKKFDLQGNLVNQGITPISAVGVRDQHSLLQLFQEGPNDKFYILIKHNQPTNSLKIPSIEYPGLEYLSNVDIGQLIDAEYQGVLQSLSGANRPIVEISIDEIDEWHLGRLFMLFEIFTAFLGEMMHIDTFNQPGVEESKKFAKTHLEKLS